MVSLTRHGNPRLRTDLGSARRLRVSSVCSDRPLSDESKSKTINYDGLLVVAVPTLVPTSAGEGLRLSDYIASVVTAADVRDRGDPPTIGLWSDLHCLAVVRGRLSTQVLSGEVVELLLDGTRKSTGAAH